jgi:hypothetical protein
MSCSSTTIKISLLASFALRKAAAKSDYDLIRKIVETVFFGGDAAALHTPPKKKPLIVYGQALCWRV